MESARWKSQCFIINLRRGIPHFCYVLFLSSESEVQGTLQGKESHRVQTPGGGIVGAILDVAHHGMIFGQRYK